MAYLREKNDVVQKWKAEELELHMQRLGIERRKQDESQRQHQEMMQMMTQQVQQQQNQIIIIIIIIIKIIIIISFISTDKTKQQSNRLAGIN